VGDDMNWGSMLVGDDYDAIVKTDETDPDRIWVIKQLTQHPLLKQGSIVGPTFGDATASPSGGQGTLSGRTPPKGEDEEEKQRREQEMRRVVGQMKLSEEGWFQTYMGSDAETLVKDLRMKRRVHKAMRDEIDSAIDAIRLMKRLEVEETLKTVPWVEKHLEAVRSLGISDRDLMSLRKFGDVRETSLRRACTQWEAANDVISKLSQVDGDWDEQQRDLWVGAIQKRKDARTAWKNTLHQSDALNKHEMMWMERATQLIEQLGPMDSRTISHHLMENDSRNSGFTIQKMARLLKTYGPDYDIVKMGKRWDIEKMEPELLLKNPWAYAAGFLDADGYITITKRGEPRAGIIATGDRGKWHCEQLHKALGCGVLQLDLKIHKNSTRTQHRLQFYSRDDLSKLLKGLLPHLRMKKEQASAVLEHLTLRGETGDLINKRKNELYRIVKWQNWKDDPNKRQELLDEWKVDEAEVQSWTVSDPDTLGSEVV
jgi:hypothetical protein